MGIYKLYVKTHILTGIKYLGYTTSTNPEKYKGSGVRWTNILKKYGSEHKTEILFETDNKNDLIEKGLFYSNLWNVVENDQWANLIEEKGDGGKVFEWTNELKEKMRNLYKGKTYEERFGIEQAKKLKALMKTQPGPWKGKISPRKGSKQGPSPFKGVKRPEISNAKKGVPSSKKGLPSPKKGKKYGHQKNPCKNLNEKHGVNLMHICPHCGHFGKGPQMFRYHFDKCKIKNINP